MGHKNLCSKQLKRVEGEICLAPSPDILNRPPTSSSTPLRRCSNGTCLSSRSHHITPEEENKTESREESFLVVGRGDRSSCRSMSHDKPFSARGFCFRDTSPKFKRLNKTAVAETRSDDIPFYDAEAGQHFYRPRRNTRHISSPRGGAGILSTIYENLETPLINQDVVSAYHHNVTSAEISLSNFGSETTTISIHEELTTAATLATADIFLRTATALDLDESKWGNEFSESEVSVPINKRVVTAASEQGQVPKVLIYEAATASNPVHIHGSQRFPGKSRTAASSPTHLRENRNKSLYPEELPPRTGISSAKSCLRSGSGDSASPSTPSDWSSQKRRPQTYRYASSSSTPPPGAPPTSAATSTSDKPPFMISFRRPKLRPRSIITNKSENSSHLLMNSTSMPNAVNSRGSTPVTAGSVSAHNNRLNLETLDVNANIVPDLNNNDGNIETNKDYTEADKKAEKSASKAALSLVTALDEKAVEGKTVVEVKAEEDEPDPDPDNPIAKLEQEEEFWNSDSTPSSKKPGEGDDAETEDDSDKEYTGKKSKGSKTDEYGSYPYGTYWTRDQSTPFISTEKGAIRFHLPGRIQHKTTIKVAHFPTGQEKNVTVNLKPDLCCDSEDDCCCSNNKNFMMPPLPSVQPPPPPCNPYPYSYGGYPYSSYYGGYYGGGGGYPPYY